MNETSKPVPPPDAYTPRSTEADNIFAPRQADDTGGVVAFVIALSIYLLLDWATFTPSFAPHGIPPWNPPIGLALAIVFLKGFRFAPLLFLAPLIDDVIVRDQPFPWHVTVAEAAATGISYSLALWKLRARHSSISEDLFSLRNLSYVLMLLGVAALTIAVSHGFIIRASGQVSNEMLLSGIARYWIGELIGISVVLPFVLIMQRSHYLPTPAWEMVFHACTIMIAIMIVFGLAGQTRLHFSYLLFLPIVLIAVRFGMPGAATGLLCTQIGVMIALHLTEDQPQHVPAFQALMMALAITGLAIGSLIDERNRFELHLRRQQEALARSARIGTLGQVTTAIAHELNQPLTAARNFNLILSHSLNDVPPNQAAALEAAANTQQQLDRSIQIIRRMREFIRIGHLEIGSHDLSNLIEESVALMTPDLERANAGPHLQIAPDLPRVLVDPLQVEQVLINLLRNSLEATSGTGRPPLITVTASRANEDFVEVLIGDNGCGFPRGFDLRQGAGVSSTKPDGLGVGLSLCHSIIESHGGTLEVRGSAATGATVALTLPVARDRNNG